MKDGWLFDRPPDTVEMPTAPNPVAEEKARRQAMSATLLRRLREGPALNTELNECVGFRYGARVFELRQRGYDILTERVSIGVFRFTLKGEPNAT